MRRGAQIGAMAVTALLGLLVAAGAQALRAEIGPVVASATIDVKPRVLPARGTAPIRLTSVTRVWTKDGSAPPSLGRLRFLFDRNGSIRSRGVPVCAVARLANTTPAVARRRCAGALVGKGVVRARVDLPGQAPTVVSSPLSFFNGPKQGGRPTLIAHAFERLPDRETHLVPIEIERVQRGRYGYRVEVELPEIADGFGAATLARAALGRVGKRRAPAFGYVRGRCDGGRLQVYGTASFRNGDFFPATLASTCRARR